MTQHFAAELPRTGRDLTDRFLIGFCLVLLGYALFGKGFAYMGVPPIFISEVALVAGLAALMWSGCLTAALFTVPSIVLTILMAWVLVRTIPYLATYGIDALRDSVIAVYGTFALVTAGLLIQRPQRLLFLISSYRRFTEIFVFAIPALRGLPLIAPQIIPAWPTSGMPVILLKDNDICVHLAGVTLFAILGFQRLSAISVLMLLTILGLETSQSRGGTVAFTASVGLAMLLVRDGRQVARFAIIGVLLAVVAFSLDFRISTQELHREISFEQALKNLNSILTSEERSGDLNDTKEWRLQWWNEIIEYTVHGRYFWTGKGFGVNLADDDGFQVVEEDSGALLRSPHNAGLTFLARGGVPGLFLWVSANVVWVILLLYRFFCSHAQGQRAWAQLFVFILCYWLAFLIISIFDVALEGPMSGIWSWTLYGVGIGAATIYSYEQQTTRGPGLGATEAELQTRALQRAGEG